MATSRSIPARQARLLLPIVVMLTACGTDQRIQDPSSSRGKTRPSALLAPPTAAGYRVQQAPTSSPQTGGGPMGAFCSGDCLPDSTVVDFDIFGDPTRFHQLTTQYESVGVTFDSTVVGVAPGYYWQNYPPRSWPGVATADFTRPAGGSGTFSFTLLAEAHTVRLYVTSLSPVTLRCFNGSGVEVGATSFAGGNTVETQGGVPNRPVVVSAPGIRSCHFIGADNQYGVDDLTVFWRASTLTLTCPTSVVRGTTGQCVVLAPGSSLQVDGWSFAPAEIDTVLQRNDGQESDTTWAGSLVASGTVKVRVRLNGVPDSASASITVTARDWSTAQIELVLSESSPGGLPAKPHGPKELGFTLHSWQARNTIQFIGLGANAGLFYFSGLPFRAVSTVSINTTALAPGSALIKRQWPTRRVHQGELYCAESESLALYLPGVRLHEGAGGRADLGSHVAIHTATLEDRTQHWAEPRVWATNFPLMAVVGDSLNGLAVAASAAMDSTGPNPFQPPCRLRYF